MENAVYICIGTIPLFYTIHTDKTTDTQLYTLRTSMSWCTAPSCTYGLVLVPSMSLLSNLLFYNTLTYSITYLALVHWFTTLVFFTTDHFILFVHSSRMFYCFVCLHVHVVGSCPAIARYRPPACLLACLLPRGYRVIPSYLKCAQLWATVFIVMCMESAVAPTSACWQLMLGRSPWSAPPSQILHMFHVIQTLLRLLVYSQLAINSSCL